MNYYYCECCGKYLKKDETGYYYESQYGSLLCGDCAEQILTYADDLYAYVGKHDYKEGYLDDEISDLEIYDRYDTSILPDEEVEKDWDLVGDDMRLGL